MGWLTALIDTWTLAIGGFLTVTATLLGLLRRYRQEPGGVSIYRQLLRWTLATGKLTQTEDLLQFERTYSATVREERDRLLSDRSQNLVSGDGSTFRHGAKPPSNTSHGSWDGVDRRLSPGRRATDRVTQ